MRYIHLTILVIAGCSLFWVPIGYIVNPGDTNWPFNPLSDLFRSLSPWDPYQGLGYPDHMAIAKTFPLHVTNSFLYAVTQSAYVSQRVFSYSLLMLSGISITLLLKEILGIRQLSKLSLSAQFMILSPGVIYYMLNPYVLTHRWSSNYFLALFTYAITPIFILALKKYLESRSIKSLTLICICFSFMLPALNNPAYFFGVGLTSLILIIQYYLTQHLNWQNFKKDFFALTTFVFIFMFYFVAIYYALSPSLENVVTSSDRYKQFELVNSGTSLSNIFDMIPVWGFYSNFNGDDYVSYSHVFRNTIIQLILPIPVLIFCYICLTFRSVRKDETVDLPLVRAIFTGSIVAMFLVAGPNSLFGDLFIAIYDLFPGLRVIREANDKFIDPICLGVSISLTLFMLRMVSIRES